MGNCLDLVGLSACLRGRTACTGWQHLLGILNCQVRSEGAEIRCLLPGLSSATGKLLDLCPSRRQEFPIDIRKCSSSTNVMEGLVDEISSS